MRISWTGPTPPGFATAYGMSYTRPGTDGPAHADDEDGE